MRVNQIGITIYDNKPTLPANRWYEHVQGKEDTTNRYKIELNFLGKFDPIKLRGALYWPPNQLRRLAFWDTNKQFYESIVDQANEINAAIRAGNLNAKIPALVAIPNMNESFKTQAGRRHFNWRIPDRPSGIIAVKQLVSDTEYQWHIQWIAQNFKETFVMDNKSTAEDVANKRHKGTSIQLAKAYPGPYSIDEHLIRDTQFKTYGTPGRWPDPEYEIFKIRAKELMAVDSILNQISFKELCEKYPKYVDQMIAEEE